jgi:ABC-type multidrug transport system fused ATPase/permease subunit
LKQEVSIDNDLNANLKNRIILGRSSIVSHLASSLQGVTSVKAFNAQKILIREFDQHTSALYMLLALHATKLRPARDWESLNCRLVTQYYKMH